MAGWPILLEPVRKPTGPYLPPKDRSVKDRLLGSFGIIHRGTRENENTDALPAGDNASTEKLYADEKEPHVETTKPHAETDMKPKQKSPGPNDGNRTGSICVRGFLGAHPWLHFPGVSLGELGEPDLHLGDRVG